MLYLAEVVKNVVSQNLELHLLAVEESKLQWTFCHKKYIPLDNSYSFPEGKLILVELAENNQIVRMRDVKDWVLNLVREYLVEGHSNPKLNINISEEQARIEKWRQELTSQSQDLTRIRLEIETRREELQELERTLNWEKEKLKVKQSANNVE
jgi:hypothetical protein